MSGDGVRESETEREAERGQIRLLELHERVPRDSFSPEGVGMAA